MEDCKTSDWKFNKIIEINLKTKTKLKTKQRNPLKTVKQICKDMSYKKNKYKI